VTDDRVSRAAERYELAMFGGDPSQLDLADRDLDAAEADLALERGRVAHARFFVDHVEDPRELSSFEQARRLYHALGDIEGEAFASFWVGCFYQVVRHDGHAALPALQHAYDIGGPRSRSYAARHLGFHALETQQSDLAGNLLGESLELRRAHGSPAEVAAALLALAEQRSQANRADESARLLGEAEQTAKSSGAMGVLRWIVAARDELDGR
jgi:hypothetical protein